MPISVPPPPKSKKPNQHFVPRLWLRRMAGPNGKLFALQDGKIRQARAGSVMSKDWLYTLFDQWWRPSDILEDALGDIESSAGLLFDRLAPTNYEPVDSDWAELCRFLALTACRSPWTMDRGHDLSKEIALMIPTLMEQHPSEFEFWNLLEARFGPLDRSASEFERLNRTPIDQLWREAEEVLDLAPEDPRLPRQLSLDAVDRVAAALRVQSLKLVDVPLGRYLVLGDVPVRLKGLSSGITVPVNRQLAFISVPASPATRTVQRRPATPAEVQRINADQMARSIGVLVSGDLATLTGLAA